MKDGGREEGRKGGREEGRKGGREEERAGGNKERTMSRGTQKHLLKNTHLDPRNRKIRYLKFNLNRRPLAFILHA